MNTNTIESQVKSLLSNVKGTTFANVTYVTDVALSAKNKALSIKKHTNANVILFAGIKDYEVYYKSVMRSVKKLNDIADDFVFEKSEATYFHDADCFSIAINKKDTDKKYLYAIYNNAESFYTMNDKIIDKMTVASYMTPSGAKALLDDKSIVYSVKNEVKHNVICRTVSLHNIKKIKAMKQEIEFLDLA